MKNKLKVYSWMLYDWACQPIHTLIATFIFGPYFVQAVAENPVEGQALIGMAVTVSGIVVAIFSPILGALADQTQKRKPWILLFSVFFVISTFLCGMPSQTSRIHSGFYLHILLVLLQPIFRQFSPML